MEVDNTGYLTKVLPYRLRAGAVLDNRSGAYAVTPYVSLSLDADVGGWLASKMAGPARPGRGGAR